MRRPPGSCHLVSKKLFKQQTNWRWGSLQTTPPPFLPLSQPVTRLFQKPFDFSGVFLSRNRVNPFAGGAGLPSEVETWQNEDDRPASEEEGEEERVLGMGGEGSGGVREEARNDTC